MFFFREISKALRHISPVIINGHCPKKLRCTAYLPTIIKRQFFHQNADFFESSNQNRHDKRYLPVLLSACVVSFGTLLWYFNKDGQVFAVEQKGRSGVEIPGLPHFSSDDVAKHDSMEKRVWVCYKSGVYDITDFVSKHPGGEQILMAAGASVEPFWELFPVHKTTQAVDMLETYRIGNLRAEDRGLDIQNMDDPFAADPRRHPVLQPRSVKPFNAECPKDLLVENFITPNEIFFVRNHLPVPRVNPEEYELEISGISIEPVTLSLKDIKEKFQKHTVTSVVQCAGNRRSELNEVKEVKGLNWGSAAIGNAEWSGALLCDVLKYAGVNFHLRHG